VRDAWAMPALAGRPRAPAASGARPDHARNARDPCPVRLPRVVIAEPAPRQPPSAQRPL